MRQVKTVGTTFTHAALSLETELGLNAIMENCTIFPTWGLLPTQKPLTFFLISYKPLH